HQAGGIDPFEMDTSWSIIQRRLVDFSIESLEAAFNFFDRIREDGLDLKDRHGLGMDSAPGQAFMSLLETMTERQVKNKGQTEDLADEPEAEFTDSEEDWDSSTQGDYGQDPESVDYSYFLEGDFSTLWPVLDEDESDSDYCPEEESYDLLCHDISHNYVHRLYISGEGCKMQATTPLSDRPNGDQCSNKSASGTADGPFKAVSRSSSVKGGDLFATSYDEATPVPKLPLMPEFNLRSQRILLEELRLVDVIPV
ncbi:6645_t:CDS:2, partial [Acaulospora colombiana]